MFVASIRQPKLLATFQARLELASQSTHNSQLMECIESSICVASLDDAEPKNDEELFKFLLSGENIGYRWADKQITLIATKNGLFGSQSEVICK